MTDGTTTLGYDPGGDGHHGVAMLRTDASSALRVETATVATAEAAYAWLATRLPTDSAASVAIGIDTLTTWSTGSAGWRPADRWLRDKYPDVRPSVAPPNSLFGAMVIGGVTVLRRLRESRPNLVASETHPKVLYRALAGVKYAFDLAPTSTMNVALSGWLRVQHLALTSDHEWDALASAWAVREGVAGRWPLDLHALPTSDGETLVHPAGPTHFFWPAQPPAG